MDTYLTRVYAASIHLLIISFATAQIIFIIKTFDNSDFEEKISNISALIYSTIILAKMYLFIIKLPQIKNIIHILRCEEFQPKNDFEMKTLRETLQNSNRITRIANAGMGIIMSMYSSPYLLQMEKNKLPVKVWLPYSNYICAILWEMSAGGVLGYADITMNLFFSILMLHVGAQCDVLCNEVVNIGGDSLDLKTELRICIRHHQIIIQ